MLGEENQNLYSKCHHPEETASDTLVSFLLVFSFPLASVPLALTSHMRWLKSWSRIWQGLWYEPYLSGLRRRKGLGPSQLMGQSLLHPAPPELSSSCGRHGLLISHSGAAIMRFIPDNHWHKLLGNRHLNGGWWEPERSAWAGHAFEVRYQNPKHSGFLQCRLLPGHIPPWPQLPTTLLVPCLLSALLCCLLS